MQLFLTEKNLSKYDMAKKKHNKLDCLSTIVLYYNLLLFFKKMYILCSISRAETMLATQ